MKQLTTKKGLQVNGGREGWLEQTFLAIQTISGRKQTPTNPGRVWHVPPFLPKDVQMTGNLSTFTSQHIWMKCGRQGGATRTSVLWTPLCVIVSGWLCRNLFAKCLLSHLPMNCLPLPPRSKYRPHLASLSMELSSFCQFPMKIY